MGCEPVSASRSAVVAGHICLDVIPDMTDLPEVGIPRLFRPGRLLEVGGVTFSTGGAVSNTGLSLYRLGVPVRLMGKIGDDLFGQAVRQIVSGYDPQLAEGMVVDPSVNTSYTIIISPPAVDRVFLHCPDANDVFGVDDILYDIVESSDLFHFGYPPLMRLMYTDDGRQLVDIYRRVKDLGVTTSLDMALPDPASQSGRADWLGILEDVLPYVDIFLPSVEETLYMVRPGDYRRIMADSNGEGLLDAVTPGLLGDLSGQLIELGAAVVGLKLGSRGFYLRTGSGDRLAGMGKAQPADRPGWAAREMWSGCFRVDVVGTTGSGDATIAGFLAAFLRDMRPEDVLTMAVAVGACNVEAADALSGVRDWEATRERIAGGWARRDLEIAAPGWSFSRESWLWIGPAR